MNYRTNLIFSIVIILSTLYIAFHSFIIPPNFGKSLCQAYCARSQGYRGCKDMALPSLDKSTRSYGTQYSPAEKSQG